MTRLTIDRLVLGLEAIAEEADQVGSDSIESQLRATIETLNSLVEAGVYDRYDTILELC